MKRFVSVAAAVGSVLVLSCGDGGTSGTKVMFNVFPRTIYTGFDGMHSYKAPVIAVSEAGEAITTGGVSWTIADATMAELQPAAQGCTIVAKKAGDTTVTATYMGKTFTSNLHVYAYSPTQYAEGEQRYKNAVDMNNPACTNCHGKGAGKGPDHTPTELDADPDDEIQNTFTTGVDPEGRPIAEESEWAPLLEGKKHMWSVTPTQRASLLAYLRALEPTGYPEYDAPTDEVHK